MLGLGRYLLGVAEIGLLLGFAWLGADRLREMLVPRIKGSPAFLATAILAIAILLWVAELLGSVGLFEPVPYLLLVVVAGTAIRFFRGWRGGGGDRRDRTCGRAVDLATLVAVAIAALALVLFAIGVKQRLSTGMTGFDSTWYHAPFAAGFFQSGDTWSLHFIAPQFLAWFYPANSEVLHAVGMVAFDRDLLSPLLNLGWFAGCLGAAWCIGRPHRVGPFALALAAIALSVPALSDQAGEARNDIVGIFFLLAAIAVAVNAWVLRDDGEGLPLGAVAVVGLAAGLAAGTKLNFLLPCAALVAGLVVVAARGRRWRTLAVASAAALAGGGYWYLRNLAHVGNPLPWIKHVGPVTLPAPEQALGGREGHSVLDYIVDESVWSDWFLPGLHHGLTIFWPLLGALALAGLLLNLGRRADPILRVAAAVGLASALAWLIAPTSASGPDGMPRGFESGLRYLAPALVLGLTLLPIPRLTLSKRVHTGRERRSQRKGWGMVGVVGVVLALVGVGYPVQRYYMQHRYADPSFAAPGLNDAFRWSRDLSNVRIATTSTRQYPLFGTNISNHVEYIGEEQPHGGFIPPTTCQSWRRLLNAGDFDYVVATRDRIEPHKPTYPAPARWTASPGTEVVLRKPPTVIYKLRTPLDPSTCRSLASR